MASVLRFKNGSVATVASTELNALANNTGALGAAYDNSTLLNTHATLELDVDFVSAPTDGSVVDVFMAIAPDGTNYGDATVGQLSAMNVGEFTLSNQTTAMKCHCRIAMVPHKIKFFFLNRSGQAFPATGSTVKIYPYTTEVAAS